MMIDMMKTARKHVMKHYLMITRWTRENPAFWVEEFWILEIPSYIFANAYFYPALRVDGLFAIILPNIHVVVTNGNHIPQENGTKNGSPVLMELLRTASRAQVLSTFCLTQYRMPTETRGSQCSVASRE